VEPEEGCLELTHDDILIVSRVPGQSSGGFISLGLGVATRQPTSIRVVWSAGERGAEKHRPAIGSIQVGLVLGSATVDAVQIETRGAVVDESVRIVLPLQATNGIERKIMVDELTQVRVARADRDVLLVVNLIFRGRLVFRLGGHGTSEILKHVLVEFGRWQRAKHSPKPTLEL